VTFGFDVTAPEIPVIDGMERVRTSGRQVTVLASRNAEAIAQLGRQRNAVSVDIAPLTLREIFLDLVQEQNRQDQQNHLEQQNALV
jgi:ABC-2 type transport system ATP-binding protein